MSEEDLYHSADSTMEGESFLTVSETESMANSTSPMPRRDASASTQRSEEPPSPDQDLPASTPTQDHASDDDEFMYSSPTEDEEQSSPKPSPKPCWGEKEEEETVNSPPQRSQTLSSSSSWVKVMDVPNQEPSGAEDIESYPRPESLGDDNTTSSSEVQPGIDGSGRFPRLSSWMKVSSSTPSKPLPPPQPRSVDVESSPQCTSEMGDSFHPNGETQTHDNLRQSVCSKVGSSFTLGDVSSTIPDASFSSSAFDSSPLSPLATSPLGPTPVPKPRSRSSLNRRQLQQQPQVGKKTAELEVKVRELTQDVADEKRLQNEWRSSYEEKCAEMVRTQQRCGELQAKMKGLEVEKESYEKQMASLQRQLDVSSSSQPPFPTPISSTDGEEVEILKRKLEENSTKICELERANAELVAAQKQTRVQAAVSPCTPTGKRASLSEQMMMKKLNASREEISQLQKQMQKMEECQQKAQSLEEEVETLKGGNEHLKQQLLAEQMQNKQLQEGQLRAIEQERDGLARQLEKLRMQHEASVAQLQAGFDGQLQQKDEEHRQWLICRESDVQNKSNEIEKLSIALAKYQGRYETDIKEKMDEIDSLRKHLHANEQEHGKRYTQLLQAKERLQKECSGIKQEKKQLSGVVKDIQNETEGIIKEYDCTAKELQEACIERDLAVQRRDASLNELAVRGKQLQELEVTVGALRAQEQHSMQELKLLQHQLKSEQEKVTLLDIQLVTFREDFAVERQAREAMVTARDKEKDKLEKQAREIRELRQKLNEQSQSALQHAGFDEEFIESPPMGFNSSSSSSSGGGGAGWAGEVLRARDPNPPPPPNLQQRRHPSFRS